MGNNIIDNSTTLDTEVRAADHRRMTAMVAGDVDTLADLCSAQLSYTHSTGVRHGKTEHLNMVSSGKTVYRSAVHVIDEVIAMPDGAVTVGVMRAEIDSGASLRTIDTRTTSTWVNDDGRWRLLAFHATPRATA